MLIFKFIYFKKLKKISIRTQIIYESRNPNYTFYHDEVLKVQSFCGELKNSNTIIVNPKVKFQKLHKKRIKIELQNIV